MQSLPFECNGATFYKFSNSIHFSKNINIITFNSCTFDELSPQPFIDASNISNIHFNSIQTHYIHPELFMYTPNITSINLVFATQQSETLTIGNISIFVVGARETFILPPPIPKSLFYNLKNLKSLNISYNSSLTKISSKMFKDLVALEDLRISSCPISKFHKNTFNNLNNLLILELFSLLITKIDFKLPKNLNILHLDDINILTPEFIYKYQKKQKIGLFEQTFIKLVKSPSVNYFDIIHILQKCIIKLETGKNINNIVEQKLRQTCSNFTHYISDELSCVVP